MLITIGERPKGGQGGGLNQLPRDWQEHAPRCPGCDRASFLSPDVIITACSCGFRLDPELLLLQKLTNPLTEGAIKHGGLIAHEQTQGVP